MKAILSVSKAQKPNKLYTDKIQDETIKSIGEPDQTCFTNE